MDKATVWQHFLCAPHEVIHVLYSAILPVDLRLPKKKKRNVIYLCRPDLKLISIYVSCYLWIIIIRPEKKTDRLRYDIVGKGEPE